MSALDKAAKVGAIHPNNAARRKSRLALRLNALAEGTPYADDDARPRAPAPPPPSRLARNRIATGQGQQGQGPADRRRQGQGRALQDGSTPHFCEPGRKARLV
jgi:hypothetical protein